jgi:hypothetical protein
MSDRPGHPRKPTPAEKRALQRSIDAEKKRKRAANKNRKSPGSNRPTAKRTRQQIMDELT